MDLRERNSSIILAKVDCTVETELRKKFEITGYPTLILFMRGKKNIIHTKLFKTEIIDYLLENLGEKTELIEKEEEIEEFKKENEAISIFYGKNKSNNYKFYEELSVETPEIKFLHIFNEKYSIEKVTLYRNFYEEDFKEIKGDDLNEENFTNFIENHKFPQVLFTLNEKTFNKFIKSKIPTIFIFVEKDNEEDEKYLEIKKFYEKLIGVVYICIVNGNSESGDYLLTTFKIKDIITFPSVIFFTFFFYFIFLYYSK